MAKTDPTVTYAEAAAMRGVSVETIRREVKRGELPAERKGRAVLIPKAAIAPDLVKAAAEGAADGFGEFRADVNALMAQIEQHNARMDRLQASLDAVIVKAVDQ